MIQEKGSISISTENILPIIKKWLYSEKDIFVRELVSNSADAISKLKKLQDIGEAPVRENEKFEITVAVSKENKTIKIIDNGIGMTADEVKKYINQIAFSGAVDFIEKYRDKTDDQQIIGHFGLGFYSAFMVAEKVQIDTLSYQEGAQAVRWISKGDTEYEMTDSDRNTVGTTVTLYMAEDSLEYTDFYKMRDVLKKYFAYLPYEIYLVNDDKKDVKKENLQPINNTNPLWKKNPRDCTDEEYKKFYREAFDDFNDPLFWIHINMEYPFRMQGIIYFPKLKHEFETMEGKIKLYYNQVFVADNIKEVIPEFLLMLKGMLDCPDLPLNVSRSYLQNEGYVEKISQHIIKKVADKLNILYKKEFENYTKYWDDINPFVKYGCMREEKFYDKVKDIIIFKTINNEYVTLNQYLERNKNKHENIVYYVNDVNQQAQYINIFKNNQMEAVVLDALIDNHFISFLESKNSNVKFLRIDADITSSLKDQTKEENEAETKQLSEKIEKLFKDTLNIKDLKIKVEKLKTESTPAIILLSEQSRRIHDIGRIFMGKDAGNMFPTEKTLVINLNNKLVKSIAESADDKEKEEKNKLLVKQIYDIALLSLKPMNPDELTEFINRSLKIMEMIV
ncbi:molecular chaperone HtpG [Thermoclostridium stercorarium subsp. thermolacticum DSM 2910]|jgi:molecular chaperone HtpG|uniref:Molecular chaperone HtpG n=1 Tax=Thermoclostridium stercorarium subsp. thermolacticum DSM 2910 TaxID=1121336 RepID=A0A1B1YDF7_THEST|nr:molecular chaperone HtpG [Thermoclostridium stercorarium]ANW98791.1 molecular chaperone HtpG [Thermoclostridium stercorarium subsp. thermolacticum DSM 2910]UZQ84417.1 molecular chaperone HtpG [Thermoclostridium stercorarium]